MAKVINPFLPEGVGCLKFRHFRNLKKDFTHVVFINENEKRKVLNRTGRIVKKAGR